MASSSENYYKSSDLSLCAALTTFGYPIDSIEKYTSSGKATFYIKKDDQFDDLLKLYFTGQLRVEPLSYFNSLKNLKTRLYNLEL